MSYTGNIMLLTWGAIGYIMVSMGQSMSELGELLEEWDDGGEDVAPRPAHASGFVEVSSIILGSGVYALLRHGEIVYIGKAKLLLNRINAHHSMMRKRQAGKALPHNGPMSRVRAVIFTGIKIMPCALSDLDRIERQMIAKYRPKYNINLKPSGKSTLAELGFNMPTVTKVLPFVRRI